MDCTLCTAEGVRTGLIEVAKLEYIGYLNETIWQLSELSLSLLPTPSSSYCFTESVMLLTFNSFSPLALPEAVNLIRYSSLRLKYYLCQFS